MKEQTSTETKTWAERNLAVNWHPYSQMKSFEESPPVFIERAAGPKLYDETGFFYYDTISSWWSNVHGHAHPKILEAFRTQPEKIDHIIFGGFTHEGAINLSETLVDLTPEGLSRVFYADNGSCAIEIALKMSAQYWQNSGQSSKTQFIGLENGYHGDTIGTMGVSGIPLFKDVFSGITQPSFLCPVPSEEDADEQRVRDCVSELETYLEAHHQSVAAMIVEPLMQGAGGIRFYPELFLKEIARVSKLFDVLFIVDEVATGFGKTGAMFACDKVGISPDFLCLSKAINNGVMPFAATLTTDSIYEAFYGEASKTFFHGHTYTANPIGCATALASIALFEEENTLSRLNAELIPYFQTKWQRMIDGHPNVSHSRVMGLIGAFNLVNDNGQPFDASLNMPRQLYLKGLENHLILRPLGDTVYLFLPFCLTTEMIDEIMQNFSQSLCQSLRECLP